MTSMTSSASTLGATRPRSLTVLGVAGFAVALALASQVAIPLPGTPVPLTLQPFVVVLAGLVLGPVPAAASMVLYLLAGAAGLPVFAPIGAPGLARLAGPTGGYLLAWPVAAWLAGRIGAGRSYARRALGATAGMVAIYAGGVAQLAILGGDWSRALSIGAVPFVLADLVKAQVAALLARPARATRGAGERA